MISQENTLTGKKELAEGRPQLATGIRAESYSVSIATVSFSRQCNRLASREASLPPQPHFYTRHLKFSSNFRARSQEWAPPVLIPEAGRKRALIRAFDPNLDPRLGRVSI
jgi:hypothetical protein